MNEPSSPEEPPIFLRIYERTKKKRSREPSGDERPNDNLVLVLDVETTTDLRQEPRFGIARLYYNGRPYRTILLTGEVTKLEGRTIAGWADSKLAEVLPVRRFVTGVFVPMAFHQRAVVVGFNLPFDLSRIPEDWEPKRKVAGKDEWSLHLVARSDPNAAYIPRLKVHQLDSTKAFIKFTGTKEPKRWYRGPFVDLRTFVHALTGERHTLKSAAEALGCKLSKTEADYHGPVTREYLDYCLNDVNLTAELYSRCLERYREFGLAEHPSRIYSPASLAKAALRGRGITPPILPPMITGRLMASFYGGQAEARIVGRAVSDVAVLDFTSQYPSVYCLLDTERFLTAERIRIRDATEEVRRFVERLTFPDLFKPETWRDPLMRSLCEVEPSDDILPLRSTFSGLSTEHPTIGWNFVSTEPHVTLPYMVPDLIAANLRGGKAPRIVRATNFEPLGRQEVVSIKVLGVEVGTSDDLVRTLTEARIREKEEKKKGWEARELGLKILVNSASYGISIEINRKRRKRNDGSKTTIYGLPGKPLEIEEEEVEEPGAYYCPLIATMVTSAAHLLLAMVDSVVENLGGRVVYCDTDSVFVTPSQVASHVAARFDSLSPYSSEVRFLKDETDVKAPPTKYPKDSADTRPRFFGLSAKRYCLFAQDRDGRPHVFRSSASDHGLGAFEAPGNRSEFVAGVWENVLAKGSAAADLYAGIPATAKFALSTPSLLPRVRNLGSIRPFTFLTARYLEPSPDPDEDRSELVPFIPTSDDLARANLMDLPRQRTWSSVLEAFIRHRDRKYLFDSEGRMIRRRILVRRDRIEGLGKETNQIGTGRILGFHVVGGKARRYVDWKKQILALPPSWAVDHGIPERSFRYLKRALRVGRIPRGHGSRTLKKARAGLGV